MIIQCEKYMHVVLKANWPKSVYLSRL